MNNPYEVLGVSPNASDEILRKNIIPIITPTALLPIWQSRR